MSHDWSSKFGVCGCRGLAGQPPYLFPLAAVFTIAMIASAHRYVGTACLARSDLVMVLAILVASLITVFHAIGGTETHRDLLVSFAIMYTGFVVVRAHRDSFGTTDCMMACLFWTALAIATIHFLLLILVKLGISPVGADPGEIVQRNGISFILIFTCFYAWFLPNRLSMLSANLAIPGFTISHVLLNGARGALLVLVFLAAARFILRTHQSTNTAKIALASAAICFVASVVALPMIEPIVQSLLSDDSDRISLLSQAVHEPGTR